MNGHAEGVITLDISVHGVIEISQISKGCFGM
jgi:hypothetical protein